MKSESLKLQAYHILKEKIIYCSYPPGGQLNEELLQEEMGMSRTPIRDALSRLEQEGLVTIRSKKGITVEPLRIKELNMIYEVRLLLECYALTTYGEVLDEDKILEFYQTFSNADKLTEEEYYRADNVFHAMLISAIPNRYIAQSYEQITNQNTRVRVLTGHRTARRLAETNAEHLAILVACMKRDWKQAAECMREHLNNSKSAAFDLLLKQNSGMQATDSLNGCP